MQDDKALLERLNIQIGEAESEGDSKCLASIVAPELAFRRANEQIDDRDRFLEAVAPGDRRETQVESIHVYGDRAVVTCVVTMKSADGEKRYHNLRLFIRHEAEWKLLGWANEQL